MANKTIPALGALATGLVSTTLFDCDDNQGNSNSEGYITGSQLAAFARASQSPAVTGTWPDITQTWTANVAAMGLKTQFDHLFGTAQSPGPGQTAIPNAAALTANGWDPYQTFPGNGGYAKVNGEPQIYMDFRQANSANNYIFNATDLVLTGTIDAGQSCTPTLVAASTGGVNLNNTTTSVTNLGGIATTNIQVGQLAGVPQQSGLANGLYRVNAINPGVSITLGTVTGLATSTAAIPSDNRAIIFLPYYAYPASSTTPIDGSHTQINFAAATIPSTVINGMIATQINSSGNWDFLQTKPYTDGCTVTAVTTGAAGNVTVSPIVDGGITITSGFIVFGPMIRSGQMYQANLVNNLMPGRNGINVIASELIFKAPRTNGYVPPGTGITLAQFNAIPSTAPNGQWMANWMFGNGKSTLPFTDSELDILEITVSENIGNKNLAVTPHGSNNKLSVGVSGGGGGSVTYGDATNAYYPVTSTYPLGGASSGGFQFNLVNMNTLDVGDGNFHKSQMIWKEGKFYWFIDDYCIKWCYYDWAGLAPPWLGMNLGCGALGGSSISANMAYPINTAMFPTSYNIQRQRLLFA